jgi:hypothetical protein
VIARILIVFLAVLLATRVRVPLAGALLAGGILLDLWAGTPLSDLPGHAARAASSPELWLVLLMTGLIVEVGRFVTERRNADEILGVAARWGGRHGRAASLVLMPAVIGLVPMPAGALFSAPFVEEAGGGDRPAGWKTAVNYWFRHVWEYWWPLYPGIVVAMSVFPVSAPRFVAAEFFYTPLALTVGYAVLIRPHLLGLASDAVQAAMRPRRALLAASPLLCVLAALMLFPLLPSGWRPGGGAVVTRLLPVIAGLFVALIPIVWDESRHAAQHGLRGWPRPLFSTLLRRKSVEVYGSLAGVLFFKAMLDQSHALPVAAAELAASGVPPAVSVAGLPLLAGFVTGVAVGFTGVSFPLVVALMQTPGSGLTPLATLVLAYGFGYAGMMLSPIHLCLLVSRDYFRSSMREVLRLIAPCVAAILAGAILVHLLLLKIGI